MFLWVVGCSCVGCGFVGCGFVGYGFVGCGLVGFELWVVVLWGLGCELFQYIREQRLKIRPGAASRKSISLHQPSPPCNIDFFAFLYRKLFKANPNKCPKPSFQHFIHRTLQRLKVIFQYICQEMLQKPIKCLNTYIEL